MIGGIGARLGAPGLDDGDLAGPGRPRPRRCPRARSRGGRRGGTGRRRCRRRRASTTWRLPGAVLGGDDPAVAHRGELVDPVHAVGGARWCRRRRWMVRPSAQARAGAGPVGRSATSKRWSARASGGGRRRRVGEAGGRVAKSGLGRALAGASGDHRRGDDDRHGRGDPDARGDPPVAADAGGRGAGTSSRLSGASVIESTRSCSARPGRGPRRRGPSCRRSCGSSLLLPGSRVQ